MAVPALLAMGEIDLFVAIHQDQDMDGVNNLVDSCSDGVTHWESNTISDYDADGVMILLKITIMMES